jgi:hypothetical protein
LFIKDPILFYLGEKPGSKSNKNNTVSLYTQFADWVLILLLTREEEVVMVRQYHLGCGVFHWDNCG